MSFGELFRKSSFTSYYKGQILENKATKTRNLKVKKTIGFGLKYEIYNNLKSKSNIKYIEIDKFDEFKFCKTQYKSGWLKATSIKRWKELFGSGFINNSIYSSNPNSNHRHFGLEKLNFISFNPPPNLAGTADGATTATATAGGGAGGAGDTTNSPIRSATATSAIEKKIPAKKALSQLTKKEWIEWIEYTKSQRKIFNQLVESRKMNELGWKTFLGLDSIPVFPPPIHPLAYLPPNDTALSGRNAHQPVTGRIWGIHDASTYLIAVSGFVGYLALSEIPAQPAKFSALKHGIHGFAKLGGTNQSKEYVFNVLEAYHDSEGTPVIQLTLMGNDDGYMNRLTRMKRSFNPDLNSFRRPNTDGSKAVLQRMIDEMTLPPRKIS